MSRYTALFASVALTIVCVFAAALRTIAWTWGVVVFGGFGVLGVWDLLQKRSTLRRNYPILAHFRYGLELRELLCAAGLEHPSELGPEHILRWVSPFEVRSLGALYSFIPPGALLDGTVEHAVFREYWAQARSDAFASPERMRGMRASKSY